MRTGMAVAMLVIMTVAAAASAASAGGAGIRIEADGPGATASATSYGDSVAIVGGVVTIDGVTVPAPATRFTARSGKTYVIDRAEGRTIVHAQRGGKE